MQEKYNPLKSTVRTSEQNYNMIGCILNNNLALENPPEEKSLYKVREMPPKAKSWEREER